MTTPPNVLSYLRLIGLALLAVAFLPQLLGSVEGNATSAVKSIDAKAALDWWDFARALIVLVVGAGLVWIGSRSLGRICKKRHSEQAGFIVSKVVNYVGFLLILLTTMVQLGFNLTTVLGAAGIATLGISIAAQTSLSNLISGLFLLWEQPFKVGDVIMVDGTRGIVLSIDLLSVKMRTLDNLYVRVPNSSIIQTQVTTITRFPIRRMDLNIGVAYKEDIKHVMAVLRDLADKNPFSLDEPEPLILFLDFGDSSLNFLFGLWFEKTNFLKLKNTIMAEIKERFDAEGIEIPFPHRSLYTGSVTDPFPIRIVNEALIGEKPGESTKRD